MNLIIATCQQGHIQEQPLNHTQTQQTIKQINLRQLCCRTCDTKLVRYMIHYDEYHDECCCNPTQQLPICCHTCENSPNITCKAETNAQP